MWFRFPPGTTAISCQQQNFAVEEVDTAGNGYFQAPEHFAQSLLAISGFHAVMPPEGATSPPSVTLRPAAVSGVAALQVEIATMQATISKLRQNLSIVSAERDKLLTEVSGLENELDMWEAQAKQNTTVTQAPTPTPSPTPVPK